MANIGTAASMFLRLEPSDAGEPLFLKLVAPWRHHALADAESIARWLQRSGASVVVGRHCGALADGRELWSYPYLEARPPQAAKQDIGRLGSGLGQLHRLLAGHPDRQRWQVATDHRIASLLQVRRALAEGRLRAGPQDGRLAALARDSTINFEPSGYPGVRAPSHGDLNLFNLLMVDAGCVFLDFEDVVHSVLPPVFDVATLFERVVLADSAADRPLELLDELLLAYRDASGMPVRSVLIAPALRGLALRAMCTLAISDPEGADAGEWDKFFNLMDLGASILPARAGAHTSL